MFNKLKQFKDLRSRAKNIQSMLSEIHIEHEHRGITIAMDGSQKVSTVRIDHALSVEEIEKRLPDVINEAVKKSQKEMVKKMQADGSIDPFKM